MKRLKAFAFLHKVVSFDQIDILSHVLFAITFFANLMPPLRESEPGSVSRDDDALSSGDENLVSAVLSGSDDGDADVKKS